MFCFWSLVCQLCLVDSVLFRPKFIVSDFICGTASGLLSRVFMSAFAGILITWFRGFETDQGRLPFKFYLGGGD